MGENTEFVKQSERKWRHNLIAVTISAFAGSLDSGLGGLVVSATGAITVVSALKVAGCGAVIAAIRKACSFLAANPIPPMDKDESVTPTT